MPRSASRKQCSNNRRFIAGIAAIVTASPPAASASQRDQKAIVGAVKNRNHNRHRDQPIARRFDAALTACRLCRREAQAAAVPLAAGDAGLDDHPGFLPLVEKAMHYMEASR